MDFYNGSCMFTPKPSDFVAPKPVDTKALVDLQNKLDDVLRTGAKEDLTATPVRTVGDVLEVLRRFYRGGGGGGGDGGGGGEWGTLTGTLSAQTDLQTALDAKAGLAAANTFTVPQIIDVNSSTEALRITQRGAGKVLIVEDITNPDLSPFFISGLGQIVQGHTSAVFGPNGTPRFQQHGGVNSVNSSFGAFLNSASLDEAAGFQFFKSGSNTVGVNGLVATGAALGSFTYIASDATAYQNISRLLNVYAGSDPVADTLGYWDFQKYDLDFAEWTSGLRIYNSGDLTVPAGSSTATGGFIHLPSHAGAPTGTPSLLPTGNVPLSYNTTANSLHAYSAGAWRDVSKTQDTVEVFRNAVLNSHTGSVWAKIVYDSVTFDSNSLWNAANSRVIPKKAGVYVVEVRIRRDSSATMVAGVGFNGALFRVVGNDAGAVFGSGGTCLVTCNGTTDYIEPFLFSTSVVAITTGALDTRMSVHGPL